MNESKNKRVLVTGKNGQLGQSIQKIVATYPQLDITFVGRDQLDLSKNDVIVAYFKKNTFDVIVNCAAYTAVDKAESEPELANQVNHLAVKQLTEIAKDQSATLIHISTDYVFNGQNHKPYLENDATDPQSVYGATKLKGESAIQEIQPNGCIIRTSWVYSEYGNNFVKTMLKLGSGKDQLGIIYDQIGTPTYAGDLAKTILEIINQDQITLQAEYPIYHFANEGVCSWYDFAQAIFELSKIDCQVNPIETKEYPTPAKRPHYSIMNKAKIKQTYNISIPYWRDSLSHCLKALEK